MHWVAFAFVIGATASAVAATQPVHVLEGQASVIDGDTLEIHGERVRLEGVDAPEARQVCQLEGKPWRCGQAAALALDAFIASRPLRCEWRARDRYGRVLGLCTVGGTDLGAWLVRSGWALAFRRFSTAYVPLEDEARAASTGLWASTFDLPWEYRRKPRGN